MIYSDSSSDVVFSAPADINDIRTNFHHGYPKLASTGAAALNIVFLEVLADFFSLPAHQKVQECGELYPLIQHIITSWPKLDPKQCLACVSMI
jgi:hypothetical protein